MKILTWNIGSFSFLKYAKYFGIACCGHKIKHEYFQPNINGDFVSKYIADTNPDIIFLQEIYSESDIEYIEILKEYPFKKLIDTWYHSHSILIASKHEFTYKGHNHFTVVQVEDMNIIPIHLNSFSAFKRLNDILILKKIIKILPNVLILGDTNIWSKGNNFLFKNDKKAYNVITEDLVDFTKHITSTSYIGFGLDKIFGSRHYNIKNIESPKIRSHFMDHYPVVLEVD